jgi:hypothetical protein
MADPERFVWMSMLSGNADRRLPAEPEKGDETIPLAFYPP